MAESPIAELAAPASQRVETPATHPPRISATFLLVVLALAMRLAMMLVAHGVHFVESTGPYPALFQNEVTNIAANIANGYGFKDPFVSVLSGDPGFGPSSWIPPAYPFFCAAVFRVFGVFTRQSFFIIVLVQCLISAFTCIPILRVAEITVGRRAGIVAASIWAVFPWFSQWANTYIWETNLSALLFLCLFWYALRLDRSREWRLWLGFGALWGFALLVNPALAPLFAISLLWLAYRHWADRAALLRQSFVAILLCCAVIGPWLIRNRVIFGEWAFIRTNFGFEFWISNYHGSKGRAWLGRHPIGNPEEMAAYIEKGELRYARDKFAIGKQFVRDYPGEFFTLTLKRIPMFWDGSTIKYNYPAAPYWLPWSFPLFSLLMIPALVLACVRRVHAWPLFLWAILLYPFPYYIVHSQVRFRHVLEPLMLLLIGYASVLLFDQVRGTAKQQREMPY
ncbi:MAG: glycosyltransferase family 39 protein [Terriglobales bacterium]